MSSKPSTRSKSAENDAYLGLLHSSLVAMMQIILKANAARTVHDVSSFSQHLYTRADQAVHEEIVNIMAKAAEVHGSSSQDR